MQDIDEWWVKQKEVAKVDGAKAATDNLDISANPHYSDNYDPMDEDLAYIWDEAYKAKVRKSTNYLQNKG